MFGGQQTVAVSGLGGLVAWWRRNSADLDDRVDEHIGTDAPNSSPSRRRPHRAAAVAAGIAWILHAALMPLTGASWSFLTALSFKTIYGAILGATVARFAVGAALTD